MSKSLPPGWRRVRLRDVLEQVNRFEKLDPDREYRLLGVKWYARGVFERESKFGKQSPLNDSIALKRATSFTTDCLRGRDRLLWLAMGQDTGLRFDELAEGKFSCPACGTIVKER
jgi:hypothetical protein